MNQKKNVAVVGPSAFVTCFELVGVEGFNAENAEELVKTINLLIEQKHFDLIIIPERFAKETKSVRENTQKKFISPLFILIPDFTMETGIQIEELHKIISLAVGANIDL